MKKTNRILAIMISVVLLMCLMSVYASADQYDAAYGQHTAHDDWVQWKDTTTLPTESGKYVLTKDVNLTETPQLQGAEVMLCLNGKTVTQSNGAFYRAYAGSVLSICDCTAHTANDGTYTAGVLTGANQGAFLFDGESVFNLYEGKITGNTSSGNGGTVVIQADSIFNMYGGEISYNHALEGSGGAVYVFQRGVFNLSGGMICNNKAATYGGAVYTGDQFNMSGGTLKGNHSGMEGGAVYITSSEYQENNQYILSDGVMNMTGGEICENTTDHNGAGVVVRGQKGIFNLHDGLICRNEANNTVTGSGHGGGVLTQSKGTINIYGGEIRDNVCFKQGGGVRTASGSVVNLHGGIIAGNTANRGAGVYLQADMNIYGGQITGNIAKTEGSGLYINGSRVIMEGGEITENQAVDGNGGGICVCEGGQMQLRGGLVEKNHCGGHGGGVLVFSGGKFSMYNGRISGNAATDEGGGIRMNGCTVEVYGGEIINNTANIGAGLYVGSDGILKLQGGAVKGNVAESGGGAMRVAGTSDVTLGNVQITENVGGTAGGIHYAKGRLAFDGAPVITGNTTKDGKTINLLYEAQEGSTVELQGLKSGAQIGVTLFEGVTAITASGATDETAACFLSDMETDKVWLATATGLELGTPPAPTEPPTTAPDPGESEPEPPQKNDSLLWIILGVVAVLAAAAVAFFLMKKKK